MFIGRAGPSLQQVPDMDSYGFLWALMDFYGLSMSHCEPLWAPDKKSEVGMGWELNVAEQPFVDKLTGLGWPPTGRRTCTLLPTRKRIQNDGVTLA